MEWSQEKVLAVGWRHHDEARAWVARPGNVPRDVWEVLSDPDSHLIEFTTSDAIKLLSTARAVECSIIDLQVMAWVLNENQKLDLEHVAKRYLHVTMDKRLRRRANGVWFLTDDHELVPIQDAPVLQLRRYCREDVQVEADLFIKLVDMLNRKGMLEYFMQEEVPFTRVLVEMELAGIPIDLEASEALRVEVEEAHGELEATLRSQGRLPKVFNPGSPPQVAAYLFTRRVKTSGRIPSSQADQPPKGFTVEKVGRLWATGVWSFKGLGLAPGALSQETGQPSTSKTALMMNPATRDHPWVSTFLEWQKLDTLLTVFLRRFPLVAREGRIYSHFKQTGTKTGRLSSSDINLQNLPARGELGKRIRGLFRTDPEHPFIIADFSQLETRIMAHLSRDPELIRYFVEERDPFIELASRIYGRQIGSEDPERGSTKNVWYALGYGAFPDKISEMVTMAGFPLDVAEATGIVDELHGIIPVYFDWRENLITQAKVDGYVTTIGGRRRNIRFTKDMSWKAESHGERAAANAAVQGSAADVVRRTMVGFHGLGLTYLQLLLQVHDELMYQYRLKPARSRARRDLQELQRMGETGHGYDLSVPLVFRPKQVLTWADK